MVAKNKYVEAIEIAAKSLTIFVGFLFLLGFLISNLQLMSLGISDFSIAKARYVMIGFTFLLYYALYLLLVSQPILAAYFLPVLIRKYLIEEKVLSGKRSWRSWGLMGLGCLLIILGLSIMAAGFLYMIGIFAGYGLQGGLTYEQVIKSTFRLDDIKTAFRQLYFAFGSFKYLYVSIITIIVVLLLSILVEWAKLKGAYSATVGKVYLYSFMGYFVITSIIVTVAYSYDTFPNVKSNIGGGHPQVGRLVLDWKKHGALFSGRAGGGDSEKAADGNWLSEPFIIWFQSKEFIYVQGISHPGASGIMAISTGDVSGISYINKVIKIKSGCRVLDIN